MAKNIKMDYKKYIQHKDYFDNGLIDLLERQQIRINNLNKQAIIWEATIFIKNKTIRGLSFKLKDLTVSNQNLINQIACNNDDFNKIIKDQEKRINELDKTIKDELEKSYDDNNKLYDENRKLREELEKLRKENNKYKKSANQNSTNSSLPPSTDLFKVKPTNLRVKSDKKVGGQKGHELHQSKLKAEADEIKYKYVSKAPSGATAVKNKENEIEYYVSQEIDIAFKTKVIETRYIIDNNHEKCDEVTMKKYKINNVSYSEAFRSMVIYLNSKATIPLERLCLILNELSENEIKLTAGSIVNWQKEFGKKAAPSINRLEKEMLEKMIINVDETGWKINGKNVWVHSMAAINVVIFYCSEKRSGKEDGPISKLKEYQGYLVHDHFKPYYTNLEQANHVECNAHILRYLKAGIEGYENIGCIKLTALFQKMLREKKELIEKNIREMSEEKIEAYNKEYLEIIEQEIDKFYEENPKIAKKYTPDYIKVMKRLKEYKEEHLKFIKDFRVPFDNNYAERMIRSIKLKKKVSGQSKTLAMAKSYAAIHTINQTCNLRGMNTLKTIEAILKNQDPFDCLL